MNLEAILPQNELKTFAQIAGNGVSEVLFQKHTPVPPRNAVTNSFSVPDPPSPLQYEFVSDGPTL